MRACASALRRAAFCTWALILTAASPAWAQTYAIDWYSAGAGGGASTGGAYAVSGNVGQAEAGQMSGGDFGVEGGFLAVVAEVPPQLTVTLANGLLTVFWSSSANGFVLDQATTLGGPTIPWTPLTPPYSSNATHHFIMLPAPSGNVYYRLHKP